MSYTPSFIEKKCVNIGYTPVTRGVFEWGKMTKAKGARRFGPHGAVIAENAQIHRLPLEKILSKRLGQHSIYPPWGIRAGWISSYGAQNWR